MKPKKLWKNYEDLIFAAAASKEHLGELLAKLKYSEFEVDDQLLPNTATLESRHAWELQLASITWATSSDQNEIQARLDSLQTLTNLMFKFKTYELWKRYGFAFGWGFFDELMLAFSLALLRSPWEDVCWYAKLICKIKLFQPRTECYSPDFLQNVYFELAAKVLDPSSEPAGKRHDEFGFMSILFEQNNPSPDAYLNAMSLVAEEHCALSTSKTKRDELTLFRKLLVGFVPYSLIACVSYQKRVNHLELHDFGAHPLLKQKYFSQSPFEEINDPMIDQFNRAGERLYGEQWKLECMPSLKDLKMFEG
jgi:hypothetical protein